MSGIRYLKKIDQFTATAGSDVTIEIPRAQDLMSLYYRVSVVTSIAATPPASSAAVATGVSDTQLSTGYGCGWAPLVKRVELLSAAKDVLHSITGIEATTGNYARNYPALNNFAAGSAAAPIHFWGIIDQQNFGGFRAKDSAFQLYNTNVMQVRFIFAPASEVYAAAATYTATVEVFVDTIGEGAASGEPKVVKKKTTQTVPLVAGSDQRFRLPTGNHVKAFSVFSYVIVAGIKYGCDGLITKATLIVNNQDTVMTTPGYAASIFAHADYGSGPAINGAANMQNTQGGRLPGKMLFDFSPRGELGDCYDLRNTSLCELIFDTTTACFVDIVTEEYIGIAKA